MVLVGERIMGHGIWSSVRVGVLNFADGIQSVYAINKNYLAQGR